MPSVCDARLPHTIIKYITNTLKTTSEPSGLSLFNKAKLLKKKSLKACKTLICVYYLMNKISFHKVIHDQLIFHSSNRLQKYI